MCLCVRVTAILEKKFFLKLQPQRKRREEKCDRSWFQSSDWRKSVDHKMYLQTVSCVFLLVQSDKFFHEESKFHLDKRAPSKRVHSLHADVLLLGFPRHNKLLVSVHLPLSGVIRTTADRCAASHARSAGVISLRLPGSNLCFETKTARVLPNLK